MVSGEVDQTGTTLDDSVIEKVSELMAPSISADHAFLTFDRPCILSFPSFRDTL